MKGTLTSILATLLICQYAQAGDQSYALEGLEKPAEIIIDEWGVPHIYANSHYDTFFVQGFNAARDRLWQIDTWRRRGLGLLSEVFGDEYVEQDRATRLFLYRGDMYREWLAYGSDAKIVAESFTAGINAYIRLIDEQADLLPPEFELLDYRPAQWKAADVVRIRSHGLLRNVSDEVRRARIACEAGLEVSASRKQLEPDWTTKIPEGLDPCLIPADVLRTYSLAKSKVSFEKPLQARLSTLSSDSELGLGSNNWVVSPSRTTTGRPILANDPHRGHSVPSLRYISHLVGPGMNVIGAGEPALPGISIGHNEEIAFGLTIFPIDQEDLYIYQKDADKYLYAGEWESFSSVSESIAVKNGEPTPVELRFTRHGPVIFENNEYAFAVRAGWLEPGMAPYFGSVEYMRASNWREFLGALNRWGAPSENQIYADTDGNIGYKPAGLFPVRNNWDGLLPVPGDGRYEWSGFFDMDVLPVEFNPQRGFTGTANSMNLPANYPIAKYPIGFEWAEPWRYNRIWQVLTAQKQHSPEDSIALQRDYVSLFAVELTGRIPASAKGPGTTMLRQWDNVMSAKSAAAALYMHWFHNHLQPIFAVWLHPANPALVLPIDGPGILRLMADENLQEHVSASIERAYVELAAKYGADDDNWSWGTLHQTRFRHPLQKLAGGTLADAMQFTDYPRGGNSNTTNNTAYYNGLFHVDAGASYRQVIDVGNWDAAMMTNAPGQSGDPRSPFYDNLLEGWATEKAFPLLYSREKVLEHRAFTITLTPK